MSVDAEIESIIKENAGMMDRLRQRPRTRSDAGAVWDTLLSLTQRIYALEKVVHGHEWNYESYLRTCEGDERDFSPF